jgi:hypothetical protein
VIRGLLASRYAHSKSGQTGRGEKKDNGESTSQNERETDTAFRHEAPEGGVAGQALASETAPQAACGGNTETQAPERGKKIDGEKTPS